MKKISIIIPAHNEEKRIEETLKDYFVFFEKLKKKNILDFEIVVVLNGCIDNTKKAVERYKNKKLKILEFEKPGKGSAIINGFKYSLKKDFDLIGFIDADGATPPEAFYDLIKNIKSFDGVIANRWDKRSKIKTKQTVLRRTMSRSFNLIVRSLFLFPHQDTQCGAKLFKRELIEKILAKLGSSEWNFDVDLLFYARRERAMIKSLPTEWNDKKESKINIRKTPFRMFFSALRLRLVHSPFKFILRFHSKLPRKMQIGYWFG